MEVKLFIPTSTRKGLASKIKGKALSFISDFLKEWNAIIVLNKICLHMYTVNKLFLIFL